MCPQQQQVEVTHYTCVRASMNGFLAPLGAYPYLDEEYLTKISNRFPSDDEVEKLLAIQTLATSASEIPTTTIEKSPSPPTNDYDIFEATCSLPYEHIHPPFNDDLSNYFDMLYISSDPNPQSTPSIVTPIIRVSPISLQVRGACHTPSSTHSASPVMHFISAHAPHLGSTLTHHRECSCTPILPPFHVKTHIMGELLNVEPFHRPGCRKMCGP